MGNFEGKRATHVEVKMGSGTRKVNAGKGVIVSAGAIYTPQLLQISGVGPRALLNQLGVEKVVSDLPAVGANFTDRLVNPQGTVMALGHYLGTVLAHREK